MAKRMNENAQQESMVAQRPLRVGRREYSVMKPVDAKGRPGSTLLAFLGDELVAEGYTRSELVRGIEGTQ